MGDAPSHSVKAIHAELCRLSAGATLTLEAGEYRDPVVITGLSGTERRPIVIRGAGGNRTVAMGGESTIFTGADTAATYRQRANQLARAHEATGSFPGLYYLADEARLILRDCQWVVVESIGFRDCWPTAVYLENCQHITLENLHFRGGTIAIGATGNDTRHLLIEGCSFVQDTSSRGADDLQELLETGRLPQVKNIEDYFLWRRVDWKSIHGERTDTGRFVSINCDYRLFDGDFFRCWSIAGYVILRRNFVFDAFNGIHAFNQSPDGVESRCSRNFLIEDNWFVRIRDNAVEPEGFSWNWTVRRNNFVDCYATFSLETGRSGYFYFYGNLGWNTWRPGPGADVDDRVSGRLFKLGTEHDAAGPHYVLHNTWLLRGPVFKKKRLAGLVHMNNVIGYAEDAEEFSYEAAAPFGSGWADVHDAFADWGVVKSVEKNRFTKFWKTLDLTFEGDVVGHPTFPDALRQAGYPLGPKCSGVPPIFEAPTPGDPEGLKLTQPVEAQPLTVGLPDGRTLSAGGDAVAGAWQKEGRFTLEDPLFATYWTRDGVV